MYIPTAMRQWCEIRLEDDWRWAGDESEWSWRRVSRVSLFTHTSINPYILSHMPYRFSTIPPQFVSRISNIYLLSSKCGHSHPQIHLNQFRPPVVHSGTAPPPPTLFRTEILAPVCPPSARSLPSHVTKKMRVRSKLTGSTPPQLNSTQPWHAKSNILLKPTTCTQSFRSITLWMNVSGSRSWSGKLAMGEVRSTDGRGRENPARCYALSVEGLTIVVRELGWRCCLGEREARMCMRSKCMLLTTSLDLGFDRIVLPKWNRIRYQAPFDRHDWEVIRPTEARMRYVIDFYPGRAMPEADHSTSPPRPNLAFYLDVRPALDSWEGVRMRLLKSWDEVKQSWTSVQSSASLPITPDSSHSANTKRSSWTNIIFCSILKKMKSVMFAHRVRLVRNSGFWWASVEANGVTLTIGSCQCVVFHQGTVSKPDECVSECIFIRWFRIPESPFYPHLRDRQGFALLDTW